MKIGARFVLALLALAPAAAARPQAGTPASHRPAPATAPKPANITSASKPAPRPAKPITASLGLNAFLDQQGQIFTQIDSNHDGAVSPQEFADYRTRLERGRLIKQYQSLFANLDANHDGALSGEEFMKLAANPRIPDPKPQFDLLDTNRDGRASRSEYLLKVTANFDRLDLNKDGVIEQSELTRSQQPSPGR
jgi:hypothetical protein